MLSFFRINAVYNILSLLVVLVVIRIPVFLYGVPMLTPELNWMLVGEQMAHGKLLYGEIWDNTSPLAALIYAGVVSLFGRSQPIFQIVALLFSAFQVIYFTLLLNQRDVFKDRTYIPGLFYLLYLHLSFDCFTLSPPLMATTFLLLALGNFVKLLTKKAVTDEVFEIGFMISLATLISPSALVYIIWVLICLIFYTGANIRQYSLLIFGFLFPIALVGLYFYLNDYFQNFVDFYIISVFEIRQYALNDFQSLLFAVIIPIVIGTLGFFRILNKSFNNFQSRVQQIMLWWVIVGMASVIFMPFLSPMQFLIFLPPMAFFSVHFFNTIKKPVVAEAGFLLLFITVIFIFYQSIFPFAGNQLHTHNNLLLPPPSIADTLRNKKIVVFGDGINEYINNKPVTPYLNWKIAQKELNQLDNYEHVINILSEFQKEMPEYIIDRQQVVPKLFGRIPALARQYEFVNNGMYRLLKRSRLFSKSLSQPIVADSITPKYNNNRIDSLKKASVAIPPLNPVELPKQTISVTVTPTYAINKSITTQNSANIPIAKFVGKPVVTPVTKPAVMPKVNMPISLPSAKLMNSKIGNLPIKKQHGIPTQNKDEILELEFEEDKPIRAKGNHSDSTHTQ